ncbi:MAG: thioredoxin fold domain-containing protein [Ginsengibacter sp.]
MKNPIILTAFMLFVLFAQAQNRQINLKENLPFEQVLKMAKKENKLIFLDFGSLTCLPCLYLKKVVFTIDSVADFVNPRFVSVDYNKGKEKERLSQLYGVNAEPVLLILDQNGKMMHRMVGKCESDELLARFRQGLDVNNNLVAQEAKYAKGERNPDFLLSYLETLHVALYTDKMNALIQDVLAGPLEQLKDKRFWDLFVRYNDDPVSREMIYVFDNREEFSQLFTKKVVENKINRHFSAKVNLYIFGHDAPVKDEKFTKMLDYLQHTDYEKATEWLTLLVPAKYKFTDWVQMAREIDNSLAFNILKGKKRETYMKMMAEQLTWYSKDTAALPYALKWIDRLMPQLKDEKTIKSVKETRETIIEKLNGTYKEEEGES